jgi:hypothetical protein
MRDIKSYAKKTLGAYHRRDTSRLVFPSYVAADPLPEWWTGSRSPDFGELIGVFRGPGQDTRGAVAITERGLLVLGNDRDVFVAYADIVGWDKLSKDPVSEELIVQTRSGGRVPIPFAGGGAFAFVQFLGEAMRRTPIR